MTYLLNYSKSSQKVCFGDSTTPDAIGPAAVKAVSDSNNPYSTLLVHYPNGQISDFQRKQLMVGMFECGGLCLHLVVQISYCNIEFFGFYTTAMIDLSI